MLFKKSCLFYCGKSERPNRKAIKIARKMHRGRAGSAVATATATTTPLSRRSSPAYERETEAVTPTITASSRPPWRSSRAFTIGRSRRSDLVIPTTAKTRTVSKLHVRVFPVRDARAMTSPVPSDPHVTLLYAKPTRWVLQDLEAMNGTSLNGVDVPPGGSIELHDGDELVLASTMRHGARMMIEISLESGATISVQLDELDSIESPVPPAPETNSTVTPAMASESPGFRTPPPPTRTLTRHTSSTVATKRERHHRDSTERPRHGHADGNEPMEDVGDAAAAAPRKRSRRLEELDDQDRCMMCPICFEYFHSSVTLPCSHTFCGLCVSSWFRSSLSCPQCRTDVTSLPVHNRALDDLVHRLAGETEGYKALVAKRLKVQLERQREPQQEPHESRSPASRLPNFRNPFLSDSPRTRTATSRIVALVIAADEKSQPLPNVFTRWKQEEIARVRSILAKQFGETRLQTCRRMGLTEASMKQASTSQTAIAMQNLLLDWWPYERVRDEGDQRLQIFLHFG